MSDTTDCRECRAARTKAQSGYDVGWWCPTHGGQRVALAIEMGVADESAKCEVLVVAIERALGWHQITHVHAALRAALLAYRQETP